MAASRGTPGPALTKVSALRTAFRWLRRGLRPLRMMSSGRGFAERGFFRRPAGRAALLALMRLGSAVMSFWP